MPNLIQKAPPSKHPEQCLTKYLAARGPAKLTQKIKHHTLLITGPWENKNDQPPSRRKSLGEVIRSGIIQAGVRGSTPIQLGSFAHAGPTSAPFAPKRKERWSSVPDTSPQQGQGGWHCPRMRSQRNPKPHKRKHRSSPHMETAFVVPSHHQLASGCRVTGVAGTVPQPGTLQTCPEDSVSLCPAERSWLARGPTPAETLTTTAGLPDRASFAQTEKQRGAVWALLQMAPRASVG